MIAVAVLVFVLIIGIEVPRMLKHKLYRELAVFGVLVLAGMVWSYGTFLDVPMPKVFEPIQTLAEPVHRFLEESLASTSAN